MDTTFYNLIYSLMSYGGLTAGAETAGSQREWMLPTGLAADPAGYAPVAEAFSWAGLSERAVRVDAAGTTGDEMAVRVQADYLSAAERAFRARHMSAVRCRLQAAARRAGHSTPAGPVGRVAQYVQNLIIAGAK